MAHLKISGQSVTPGSFIPLNMAKQPFNLTWNANPQKLYTVMLTDLSAPHPEDNIYSPFLHWLVVNVPGNDINRGDVLMEYEPPNPPSDSNPHTYIFDILEQSERIRPTHHRVRANFALEKFVERNNLIPLTSTYFSTGPRNVRVSCGFDIT